MKKGELIRTTKRADRKTIDGVEYVKKDDIEYIIEKAIRSDLDDCFNNEERNGMKLAILSVRWAVRQLM